jgi:hypothetical protein
MGISVDPEVVAGLVPEATLTVQARSAAAPAQLLAGLRAAAADLSGVSGQWRAALSSEGEWQGPRYVGPVVPLPDGPAVVVDVGAMPPAVLRDLPRVLVDRLAGAGVTDAVLVRPPNSVWRYEPLRELAPAARALLRARPRDGVPGAAALLDAAAEWLGGEGHEAPLRGLILSVEVDVEPAAVGEVIGPVLAAGSPAVLVRTGFAGTAAAAALDSKSDGRAEAAFTLAGEAGAAALHRQRDVIRSHAADLVWAGITIEPDANGLLWTRWWDRDDGGSARPTVDGLSDILVPDAMWCQVLSAGHIERLGGPPPGAVEVTPGRFELTVGEPDQWRPGHPDRDEVRAAGRELVAGCLVTAGEAKQLARERIHQARRRA